MGRDGATDGRRWHRYYNPQMALRRPFGYLLVALTALAFGFLLAAQLRTQLLTPSNRVARSEALVHTVQDLERTNAADRSRIAALRAEIGGLEAQMARRSDATMRLQQDVEELRAHAGLTPLRGPGVTVQLADGRQDAAGAPRTAYLVTFEDIQDVVYLLFEGGAEGVAVNGRRVTPASTFAGAGSAVVIDQGPALQSPFRVAAVGNRNQMEQLLNDPSRLGDLRERQRRYALLLTWSGGPDVSVPAYDAGFRVAYAEPA